MTSPRPIRRDTSPEELAQKFPNGPPVPKHEHPIISYTVQYWAAVVVAGLSLIIGAIQLAGPESLGFSPVAARWLGVIAAVLAGLSAVLPKIQKPPDGRG